MRKFLQKKRDCAIFYFQWFFFYLNDSLLRYKDSMPRVLFICLFVLQEYLNYFRNVSILFYNVYARLRFISDNENIFYQEWETGETLYPMFLLCDIPRT